MSSSSCHGAWNIERSPRRKPLSSFLSLQRHGTRATSSTASSPHPWECDFDYILIADCCSVTRLSLTPPASRGGCSRGCCTASSRRIPSPLRPRRQRLLPLLWSAAASRPGVRAVLIPRPRCARRRGPNYKSARDDRHARCVDMVTTPLLRAPPPCTPPETACRTLRPMECGPRPSGFRGR